MTDRKGRDYTAPQDAKKLKEQGYEFVGRYLSHSAWKNFRKGEIEDLHNNGLKIIVVWETTEERTLSGMAAGCIDAQAAVQQLKDLGVDPSDKVIYFAVDFDAQPNNYRLIGSYFAGVKSVLPVERIGVYGGYRICKYLFDTNAVEWGWQTFAWSRNADTKEIMWDERAQVRQITNGTNWDEDIAMTDDYGGF